VLPQVLHVKPFRDLWLGQAISQLGDALFYVVFMFMVKKLTGSVAMVGYVGALEAIPYLLFSPYAGVLADRLDRRKLMLLSDMISGIALLAFMAVILGLGSPPIWLIFTLAFSLSSVRCFFMPAKSAAIPALVPSDLLMKANALSSATQSFMPLIGLALSAGVLGLLYATAPSTFFATTVGINALSFLVSAVFIARLPKILPEREDTADRHPAQDFVEGVRYVAGSHLLKVLFVVLGLFRLMVSPFFVAYIAANEQWFGGRPQTLAWMEFWFFLGMIGGSAWAGRANIKRAGLAICLGLGLTGGTVAAMGWSPHFWLFCVWNFLAGIAIPFADIPISTLLQVKVPDAFRGRVNSVLSMISAATTPIGMMLAGLLVERAGLVAAFLVMGLGMIAASLIAVADGRFRTTHLESEAPELRPLAEIAGASPEASAGR
jgi:MFS transporter, DHA3 family, macrolide efflux protein